MKYSIFSYDAYSIFSRTLLLQRRPYEPAGVVELRGVSPLLRGPQPTVYCLVTRTLRLCCTVIIVCLDYLLILYICVCENKTPCFANHRLFVYIHKT